jgi:uncharacterized damage-inducible protein DinB
MPVADELLQELQQEAAVTRQFLQRVPFEKAAFKPHEKSETLGRLAIHVAEIVAWWKSSIEDNELDFIDFEPQNILSAEDLVAYFDGLLAEAESALRKAQDKDFDGLWSMRHGEEVLFTLPKKQVARTFCLHHLIHHRAQLGIYLRLLDVPVPATYGPSADDDNVLLTEEYH